MAHITAGTRVERTDSLIARAGSAIFNFLVRVGEMSEGARAARHAGRLARLSDDELARHGLTRDQIVSHAFRNLLGR